MADPRREAIERLRRRAKFWRAFGLIRATVWTVFGALYFADVPWVVHASREVATVLLVSLYANAATDYGQSEATSARVEALEARLDVEELSRRTLATVEAIEDHQLKE